MARDHREICCACATRRALCRSYADNEMQAATIDSPFQLDGSVVKLFNALYELRDKEGKDVSTMAESIEKLASSNSERGALTSQLLPPLHWVMLTGLSCLLMTAFLLYDSDFVGLVDENRHIFAVLCATFISVLWVRPRSHLCMLPNACSRRKLQSRKSLCCLALCMLCSVAMSAAAMPICSGQRGGVMWILYTLRPSATLLQHAMTWRAVVSRY